MGGGGGEWKGLEPPQTVSVPPPGICLDDTILSEARLYLRSIEIFHCRRCLCQPKVA